MKKLKIHRVIFVLVILSLLPANLLAIDYAKLNFIGFSNDGKYLAFEEYGTDNGADNESYANIFFVDVAKNSFAAKPINKVLIGSENNPGDSLPAVRTQAKNAAAPNLKKFRIVTGNTGDLVVARLITDLGGPNDQSDNDTEVQTSGDQVIYFTNQMFFGPVINKFVLSLKTIEVKLKACENRNPIFKFELYLRNEGTDAKKERVLHKDPTLPPSRGCAESYSIQNVYLYNNHIAVFLNVYLPGLEGKDMRYLVVTANQFAQD